MASYVVNERALEKARRLIEGRQYVLDSDWGRWSRAAAAENDFSTHIVGGVRRVASRTHRRCMTPQRRCWRYRSTDGQFDRCCVPCDAESCGTE
jgi:cobalamin biosynthesis protein CobT